MVAWSSVQVDASVGDRSKTMGKYPSGSTARFWAGSTVDAVVPLRNGPVVPLRDAICTNWMNTGRKTEPKIVDLRGKSEEFGAENLWKCRSTPKTTDLWIKTTKNSTNPEIKFRTIFWDIFQIFSKKNLGGGCTKSVRNLRLLIPYDVNQVT